IHNEFLYGRKLDPKKYYLEIDVLMLIIWLKAKRYTMQYPLWKMLTTYLELQKALIKKQEWDKEKSLTDNFKKLKLIEKLDSFHDAVLDYMKLGQLVGFTDDRSNDLYLFPTDVNKEVKTDFRDAYRWAYYEYHLFIQPMYVALSRGTKEAFEKAFEK
ncbi:MAG3960 family lipoprotein, partial [Mycoplasmopsis bovis]